MNSDLLSHELLSLTHTQRVQRLVAVGSQARTDPELGGLLERWERGDWQERQWALIACWGSQDGDRPIRMIGAPSRSLAGLAIRLLAQFGSDQQAEQALLALPARRRRRLLQQLRCRRRFAPLTAFVRELQTRQDPEAFRFQHLVPGQDRTAGETDSGLLDPVSWQRRAVSQPEETAAQLIQALDAREQPDGLLFRAALSALGVLSSGHPDLALQVIRA